jgi:hypothetical protein
VQRARQAGSFCQISKSIPVERTNIPAIAEMTRRGILTENLKHDCLCNTGRVPEARCAEVTKGVYMVLTQRR